MNRLTTIISLFAATLLLCSGSCNSGVEEWEPDDNGEITGGNTEEEVVPAGERWAALADSCTNVLISNYFDKTTGTFWASQRNMKHDSEYIYWQQAHALDVLLYSYRRIKATKPNLAATYESYFKNWYDNDANNYNNSHDKEGEAGGFFNDWTDDMAWICLTLLRMTEFTGNELYAGTAREVFDKYIWTRSTKGPKGVCLPWTNHDEDRNNFNACTNTPSCLVAALLYNKYKEASYLKIAKDLYDFNIKNMPDAERVEEPPLTYTQGTFGEAARVLYHITGEKSYMDKAGQVLRYAMSGNRTTSNGLLRSEGDNMDQSIFKAVLIPYAVNYVLDQDADKSSAMQIKEKLLQNAEALDKHLDRTFYPNMFANYYWGETVPQGNTVSMGAQASGAALIEGVARMVAE